MTKQLALGSLLGAIVLFVWSVLAWEVIPWPGDPLRAFTNPDAMEQAIKANVPVSGNYLVPNKVKRTGGEVRARQNCVGEAGKLKFVLYAPARGKVSTPVTGV